jgi:hypothetical protein
MFRLDDGKRRLRRQDLADPDHARPLLERLEEAGAVDLRGNAALKELGGGYATIEPRDSTKCHWPRHGG